MAITTAMVVSAIVSTAVGFAFQTALQLLRPTSRPRIGFLNTNLGPGGPKRVVFGRAIVGAARLIANERVGLYHHWVAALSDQPIASVDRIFIRGQEVEIDGDGWVTTDPWGRGGARIIRLTFFDGTQSAADLAELVSLGLLPSGSIGVDTAIVWVRVYRSRRRFFQQLLAGTVPEMLFEVKGAKVYDPTDGTQDRDDPTTWKWARESILVQAYHQVSRLGRGRDPREIDWDQVAAILPRHREEVTSKNGDAGPRFAADGAWATGERHEEVEARIGATHAGGLVDMATEAGVSGALQRFYTSDTTGAAVMILTPEDIGPDGIERRSEGGIDTRPNGVRVSFLNRNRLMEPDTVTIVNAAWRTEDGGTERLLEINAEYCSAHVQAATLGLIALNRARLSATIRGQWAPDKAPLQADDKVGLALPELDLAGTERWRVELAEQDERDYAVLRLTLDLPAWHADAGAAEPDEVVLPDVAPGDPAALPTPTVTVTSGAAAAVQIAQQVLAPGLKVRVQGPADAYERARIKFDDGLRTWDYVLVIDGADDVSGVYGPFEGGASIDWYVTVEAEGDGAVTVAGTITVQGDITAPAAPTNLSASDGGGAILASAKAPADSDVVELVFGYVPDGDPAPDLSTDPTRAPVAARPSQSGILAGWSVAAGDWDVYVAAVDAAGNYGPSAGPYSVTVS